MTVRRCLPDTLFGRLTLILLLGFLLAHGVSLALYRLDRERLLDRSQLDQRAERIAETVRRLDELPSHPGPGWRGPEWRGLGLMMIDDALPAGEVDASPLAEAVGRQLDDGRAVRSVHGPLGPLLMVQLQNGRWAGFRPRLDRAAGHAQPPPTLPLLHLGLTLLVVIGASLWAVRWATTPLRQLAEGAAAFAGQLDQPSIPEQGPREARQAAQAFNAMQQRIRQLLDERTQAFSAMSHDLRTPLTRLRLRVENVDDDVLRERLVADLDAMQQMVQTALDFVRGLHDQEPVRPLDLDALLASLAADLGEQYGVVVAVHGQALAALACRSQALRRALTNLLDNALRYAGDASLRIEDAPHRVRLIVEDRGPGVPAAELDRLTEPFYRIENSRNRASGGSGLGLGIVAQIAALHGGRLHLANRSGGGLYACLELPRLPRP